MANEVQIKLGEMLTDKLVSVADALPKDFNRERYDRPQPHLALRLHGQQV